MNTKLTIEFTVSTPLGTRYVKAAITVACPGGVYWSVAGPESSAR